MTSRGQIMVKMALKKTKNDSQASNLVLNQNERHNNMDIEDFVLSSGSEYLPSDGSSTTDSHISNIEEIELIRNASFDDQHINSNTTTPNTSISLPNTISYSGEEHEIPIKGRKRKRKCNKDEWHRNKVKILRNLGKEYITKKGKHMKARQLKPINCKCQYKCKTKFTDEQRQEIFTRYWNIGNLQPQRDYIISNTKRINKRRKVGKSDKRVFTIVYKLPIGGNTSLQVCRQTFLSTLGETERKVKTAINKERFGVSSTDKRVKHLPSHSLSIEVKNKIHSHIQSFPCVPSHYTRKDTKRQYLESTLNIKEMYRLYTKLCIELLQKPASFATYGKIFREEYNLGFLHPKKDRCDDCQHFENMTDSEEKEKKREDYDKHKKEKDLARKEMTDNAQVAANSNNSFYCFSSDLQQVLQAPYNNNKGMYYKRKLSVYNFTIYNNTSKKASCYFWHEVTAARGSCEMASCFLKHLSGLPDTVTHVVSFSDGCGGQNRNRYMCALWLYAVQFFPNIMTIEQKFLIKGHSEMPCDSVHAAIETAKKGRTVYAPSDWYQIAQNAKKEGIPYDVIPMSKILFFDFKVIAEKQFNLQIGGIAESGSKIKWSKVE